MKEKIYQLEAERDALMAAWKPKLDSPAEASTADDRGRWPDRLRHWLKTRLNPSSLRIGDGWERVEAANPLPPA